MSPLKTVSESDQHDRHCVGGAVKSLPKLFVIKFGKNRRFFSEVFRM